MPDTITIRLASGKTISVPSGMAPEAMQQLVDQATQMEYEAAHPPNQNKPHFSNPPIGPGGPSGFNPAPASQQPSWRDTLPMMAMGAGGIPAFLPRLATSMGLVAAPSIGARLHEGEGVGPAIGHGTADALAYGAGPELFAGGLGLLAKPAVRAGLIGRAAKADIPGIADTILKEGYMTPGQATRGAAEAAKGPGQVRQAAIDKAIADRLAPLTRQQPKALPPATREVPTLAADRGMTWTPKGFDEHGNILMDPQTGVPHFEPPTPPHQSPTSRIRLNYPAPTAQVGDKIPIPPGAPTPRTGELSSAIRDGVPTERLGDFAQPTPPPATTRDPYPWELNPPARDQFIPNEIPDAPRPEGPGILKQQVTDQPSMGPWQDAPKDVEIPQGPLDAAQARADQLGKTATAMNTYQPHRFGGLRDAIMLGSGFGLGHTGAGVAVDAALHALQNPGVAASTGNMLQAAPRALPPLMHGVDLAAKQPVSTFPLWALVDKLFTPKEE